MHHILREYQIKKFTIEMASFFLIKQFIQIFMKFLQREKIQYKEPGCINGRIFKHSL